MRTYDEKNSTDEQRRETRKKPYPYLPYVIVNPDGEPKVTGFIRNVSKKGFSAEFEQGFPFVEEEILDVRVGYQRAWARVVWVETVFESIKVVGFELHPDEFLERILASQSPPGAEE